MFKLNKKGDAVGDSFPPWLLGLILVLIVAVGLFLVWGKFKGVVELSPGELAEKGSYCRISPLLSQGASAYCNDYKSLEYGDTVAYQNCYDIGKKIKPAPDWADQIVCDTETTQLTASSYCANLQSKGDLAPNKAVFVSGFECIYTKRGGTDPYKDEMVLKFNGKQINDLGEEISSASCLVTTDSWGCTFLKETDSTHLCSTTDRYSDTNCETKIA